MSDETLNRIAEEAAGELNIEKDSALAMLRHLRLDGLIDTVEHDVSKEMMEQISFGDLRVSARVAKMFLAQ